MHECERDANSKPCLLRRAGVFDMAGSRFEPTVLQGSQSGAKWCSCRQLAASAWAALLSFEKLLTLAEVAAGSDKRGLLSAFQTHLPH